MIEVGPNIPVGAIVEFLNEYNDYKQALILENIAGHYYSAMLFSGQIINITHDDRKVPACVAGKITSVIATNLNEYLSQ